MVRTAISSLALAASATSVVACNGSHGTSADARTNGDATSDALADAHPFTDAYYNFCDAAPGAASIMVTGPGGTTNYDRVHAGGIWLTGPVARTTAAPPLLTTLWLTSVGHVDPSQVSCCTGKSTCCTTPGVVVSDVNLAAGSEIGEHAATVFSAPDSSFQLNGTLDVTGFAQPFEQPPGRIAGSVFASGAGFTITGSFANSFCLPLLQVTI